MNRLLKAFPRVMGIVNLNDDSFPGEGGFDVKEALHRAICQVLDGADLIDVGVEGGRTRTGELSAGEEMDRLIPFIDSFSAAIDELQPRDEAQIWPPKLSVNTCFPEVVAEVLKTGEAAIINDLGGLADDDVARLCFEFEAALLVTHSASIPMDPHFERGAEDVWAELERFFDDRLARARRVGLNHDQLLIDPGIDLGKHTADSLAVFNELERLSCYELPILLPISRSSMIGEVLRLEEPGERDAGTIACLVRGMAAHADIFRVHQVKAAADCVRVMAAIQGKTLN